MGSVYVAEHVVFRRTVALKLLHPALTQNEQITQRFINEAYAASILNNEHIIKVTDCQQDAGSGAWFIAMEHLRGQSLATYLATQPRALPLATTTKIACQIAEALDEAHAHGIVHRDIKPDNIFLIAHDGNAEFVKVLDFGIAKLRRDEPGMVLVTRTNAVLGTQPFMPPEQLRGQAVDHRADVFALAVVIYLALSHGYHPFQNNDTFDRFYQLSTAELCIRQLGQDPVDLRRWNASIPEAVAAVLAAGLHRDRARRPRSAGDLVVELARAGNTLDVVGRHSSLLAETAARRSIQISVPDALPPPERATVRITPPELPVVSTAPELRAGHPSTTLKHAASEQILSPAAPTARPASGGKVIAIATAASLAIGGGAFGALGWWLRHRGEARHDSAEVASAGAPSSALPPDAAVPSNGAPPRDASVAPADAPAPTDASTAPGDAGVPPAQPRPRGSLIVTTAETFADVYLDGVYAGSTPLTLKVPVGAHKVVLAGGAHRETVKVNVTTSRPTVIEKPW